MDAQFRSKVLINKMFGALGYKIISKNTFNYNLDLTDQEKIVNHIIDIVKEDFIIYSDYDSKNVCTNKKIIVKDSTTSNCSDNDFIYEVSDIKFFLVELKFGEKNSHKIELKTDEFNFYVVGNSFNKQFFIYYLKQILKISEEIKDDDKFNLKILDHNVNTVELDFTDQNESILLEKTGYKLLNLNISDDNK